MNTITGITSLNQVPFDSLINAIGNQKNAKNLKWAINRVIKEGLVDQEEIVYSLVLNQDETLKKIQELSDSGKLGNGSNITSLVRTVAGIAELLSEKATNDFGKYLHFLLKNEFGEDLGIYELSRKILAAIDFSITPSQSTIADWLTGKRKPSRKSSYQFIEQIEKHFEIEDELLKRLKTKVARDQNASKSPNRKLCDIPERVKNELDVYFRFKVSAVYEYPGNYHDAPEDLVIGLWQPKLKNKWVLRSGTSAAAEGVEQKIKGFFDTLQRENIADVKEYDLSFVFDKKNLLLHTKDCESYGNHPTGIMFLQWVWSELDELSYVRFSLTPSQFDSYVHWSAHLDSLKATVKALISRLEKQAKSRGKNPAVLHILTMKDPISYVKSMVMAFHDEISVAGKNEIYSLSRSELLFKLCLIFPLRSGNWRSMRYLGEITEFEQLQLLKENTVALYSIKEKDSQNKLVKKYFIYINKLQFKNFRSSHVTDVNFDLTGHEDDVERYLKIRSSFLRDKAVNSEYLFFIEQGSDGEKKAKSKIGDMLESLSQFKIDIFRIMTRLDKNYVSGGINIHSMRNLAPSIYLILNPKDYVSVASMLMDKLETVINKYHVATHEPNLAGVANIILGHLKGDFEGRVCG